MYRVTRVSQLILIRFESLIFLKHISEIKVAIFLSTVLISLHSMHCPNNWIQIEQQIKLLFFKKCHSSWFSSAWFTYFSYFKKSIWLTVIFSIVVNWYHQLSIETFSRGTQIALCIKISFSCFSVFKYWQIFCRNYIENVHFIDHWYILFCILLLTTFHYFSRGFPQLDDKVFFNRIWITFKVTKKRKIKMCEKVFQKCVLNICNLEKFHGQIHNLTTIWI